MIELPTYLQPENGLHFTDKQWLEKYWWLINYIVDYRYASEAQKLANELWEMEDNPDQVRIDVIIEELRRLNNASANRTPLEWWTFMAHQMPQDVSGGNFYPIICDTLSSYQGRMLEAMCGWNSYFKPSSSREIIALDYCQEALERYPYPRRVRILCDLNSLQVADDIGFCPKSSLDVISICFGFRYLEDPIITLKVLYDLLKIGGKIVFVENPLGGYKKLVLRSSKPQLIQKSLIETGFQDVFTRKLTTDDQYYLIEGAKSREI